MFARLPQATADLTKFLRYQLSGSLPGTTELLILFGAATGGLKARLYLIYTTQISEVAATYDPQGHFVAPKHEICFVCLFFERANLYSGKLSVWDTESPNANSFLCLLERRKRFQGGA